MQSRFLVTGAAALALIAFGALIAPPGLFHNDRPTAHSRELLSTSIDFGTSTSFPSDITDVNGWVHYGIYVGFIVAMFIISGITIGCCMCWGFCCRKCCGCLDFANKGSRTFWTFLFMIVYGSICVLCLLGIIFTALMGAGITQSRHAANTFLTTGANGAFDNARDVIAPLTGEFFTLINTTVDSIRNNAFIPLEDFEQFANTTVQAAADILVNATVILNQTNDDFDTLRNSFTLLRQYQDAGYISGIPNNDTVPNVTDVTSLLINNAQEAIATLQEQVANLTDELNTAKSQINTSSPTIKSILDTLNSTVDSVLGQIDNFQYSYGNMSLQNYTSDDSTAATYIKLQNQIRVPILVFLFLMPVIMYGLWIAGRFTQVYNLMLVGFWYSAITVTLVMLLGAIHVILFIPTKDLCLHHDQLIQGAASQFLGPPGSNYSDKFGVTDPAAAEAINTALDTLISNPDLILKCSGTDTIIELLNINVPNITGVSSMLNNVSGEVSNQVNQINITGQIEAAQPRLAYMSDQVSSLYYNISIFNETIANYSSMFQTFNSDFAALAPTYWNQSSQDWALGNLSNINSITDTVPYFYYYDFSNVSSMDPNLWPLNKPELIGNQTIVEALIALNDTVNTVGAQLVIWNKTMHDVMGRLGQGTILTDDAQNLVDVAWARVNASSSLAQDVIDAVLAVLNPAINQALQIASLPGLGACAFIGNFWKDGIQSGFCERTSGSAGGVAITIFLLAYTYLFSWPIILSSKYHFAGDSGGVSSQEMSYFNG